MKGNKNLLQKLLAILMVTSIVTSCTGCANNNYSKYVVTNENDTLVLHKAKRAPISKRYTIKCGVEKVEIEACYDNSPKNYAYDVECEECFPE